MKLHSNTLLCIKRYRNTCDLTTLLKNTIENVMGLMVIMGIALVLMEAIMVSTGM